MNTKTLNTYEKLWLANRASHNMALAGPTAFWLASGHREARPLVYKFMSVQGCATVQVHKCLGVQVYGCAGVQVYRDVQLYR